MTYLIICACANLRQEAWRVLARLADICRAVLQDSPDSPTFAKPFARTRRTRRHLPKAIFEKNVTRLAKFARVIRESRKFGESSHCLVLNQKLFSKFLFYKMKKKCCKMEKEEEKIVRVCIFCFKNLTFLLIILTMVMKCSFCT
jgi:hypothetical protein